MAFTKDEVKQIRQIIREETARFGTKEELTELKTELKAAIKNLPTRDEFFTQMSEIMDELQTIRESITILNGRTSEHEDRITNLEKIHPNNQHISS